MLLVSLMAYTLEFLFLPRLMRRSPSMSLCSSSRFLLPRWVGCLLAAPALGAAVMLFRVHVCAEGAVGALLVEDRRDWHSERR